MERRIKLVFLTMLSCVLLINCSTMGKKGVSPEEYSRIVWESRIAMETAIFKDIKNIVGNKPVSIYAVVNSEYNPKYSQYYERHIAEWGGVIVATRRTDALDREFNFQYSGRVSDDEMRGLGRMLGVNHILLVDATLERPSSYTSSSNTSNDTWQFTLYEIEKGLVLYSFTDAIAIHREAINKNYYIVSNNRTSLNAVETPPIRNTPFYYETPIAEIELDFGHDIGILSYWGFRPSKEEFSLVLNSQYFRDSISPSETLLIQSYYSIENNTALDERVKTFMRLNNLTFSGTLIENVHGGFTYYVNYSFDNHRTFGLITMDSTGYVR